MGLLDLFRKKPSNGGAIVEHGKPQEFDFGTDEPVPFLDNDEMVNENGTGHFRLVVDDVFSITGRGTVVVGKVTSGEIYVGNSVFVKNNITGEVKTVKVTGIEMFRKLLDYAKTGDNVGMLLAGMHRNDVNKGDEIYT